MDVVNNVADSLVVGCSIEVGKWRHVYQFHDFITSVHTLIRSAQCFQTCPKLVGIAETFDLSIDVLTIIALVNDVLGHENA